MGILKECNDEDIIHEIWSIAIYTYHECPNRRLDPNDLAFWSPGCHGEFGHPERVRHAWDQTNRAQIQLKDTSAKVVAWIRFNDPGQFFEDDHESDGIIRMHLPSTMLENVIDMLRNEKPVYIYFATVRAFLGTFEEPVGEGEA